MRHAIEAHVWSAERGRAWQVFISRDKYEDRQALQKRRQQMYPRYVPGLEGDRRLCFFVTMPEMSLKPRRPPKPRPNTRAELLARERETWNELAAAWRGLPDPALALPGACGPGWSVKDVMNHVAAWQEAALRIIPELLQGRRATLGHGTSTFNALSKEADQDRSLAATRRRLNKSRRDLRALVARVPEKRLLDVDDRVGWWVKFTTYAHYGEHIYELTQFREKNIPKG
jgi:hypothetical protein